jgi:hypothetical protein
MFNWTKVLLGSAYNLADIANHASAVSTITTMKLFDEIQVIKILPIKTNVVFTTYFINAINRKTSQLLTSTPA